MKTRDELWHDCSRHFSRGEVFERARQNFSGVLFSESEVVFSLSSSLSHWWIQRKESRNLKYKKMNHNTHYE